MHPILARFSIGGHTITIYAYGLFAAVGLAVGWACGVLSARRFKLDPDVVDRLIIYSVIVGLVSAHYLYLWQYPEEYKGIISLVNVFSAGRVWYGGFLASALFAVLYLRWKKTSVLKYFDLLTPCVALGHAFGRIGCFFHGCCYGRLSLKFGIYLKALGVKVIPTQLLSSLGLFLLFVVLTIIRKVYGVGRGIVLGWYLLLYGIMRFGIEFLRGDPVPVWWHLRFSQWMSLGLIVFGGLLLWRSRRLR